MKKIAFVIKLFQDSNFHGGGEKLFFKLIDKFIKNNYTIDIYCSETNVDKYQGINKIIVVNKPYNHVDPISMEAFYGEVKKLAENENYDHIISENITPQIGITFLQGHSLVHRQKKLKNVIESFLYNFRSGKKLRIKYQEKWMKQGHKRIFTVSNILKNDIIENFNIPENKISVIYPGVDIPDNINEIKDYSQENELIFGLSAPGFKLKGGYIFLNALKILKNKGFSFKARIIYPKAKKNLGVKLFLKLYGIEKQVEFLGFQKDMQEFYKNIDCVVIPSYEDTFNLVALEAMANKKLCIVSSNCGASEIINDSQNGFVFNMSNPEKNLAEKLEFVIKNKSLINKWLENGFKTAKNYSWDKTFFDFINDLK